MLAFIGGLKFHVEHLCKPRVLSPLSSMNNSSMNEVDIEPFTCKDACCASNSVYNWGPVWLFRLDGTYSIEILPTVHLDKLLI